MADAPPTPKIDRRLLWLFVLVAGAAALARAFFGAPGHAMPSARPESAAAPVAALLSSRSPVELLPKQGGPPGYVSSAACKECHPKQFESWWRSHHRQMTQVMSSNTVQAQFEGVVLDYAGARFTLHQSQAGYWADIQDIEGLEAARGAGAPEPVPLRLPMVMVTGSHYFQVFWIATGHGNRQMGFPFTWLVAEKHWVPRNDAFIRDPDIEPRPEQWNLVCIRCHATGARPMPVPEQQRFDTHVTELGIACEACHGPGERHVTLERNRHRQRTEPDPLSTAIVQPAHLDHVRSAQVCGFCHSMKWFLESPSWKKDGFTYRPGDDLEATTPVMRPSKLSEQPWLADAVAKHPDILEQFFWRDGAVRVTGREFNGLLESACYQKGELTCVSCHSMHKSDPDKQLKPGMEGNDACLSCHHDLQANLSAHTHHKPVSSGSLCYNCHMPYTSYGLLRSVRSHQIDRPTVTSVLETGRPNACNLCHLDKTLDWTAKRLSDWYSQPRPQLDEQDRKVALMVRLLLSGDTGQRALAAFALGWGPALAASGKDWEAPLLAELLDDRYAAVRFISHRSLTHLPGFDALPYDFDSTPAERSARRQKILDRWRAAAASLPRREATLTGPGPFIDTGTVSKLVEHRDNRPVHLRE